MDQQQLLAEQLSRCQAGSKEAFAWLLSEYGPRLYRYFYRTCGRPDEAEDLLQELFVRLLEKIRLYNHQGKFEHWLFCVAANLHRDRLRQVSRTGSVVSLQKTTHEDLTLADSLAADDPPPDRHLDQEQEVADLQAALEQLPPMDREIILLRHYGGLSFKELAAHFQIPTGTALAKVHRGLKRLRKLMRDDYEIAQ